MGLPVHQLDLPHVPAILMIRKSEVQYADGVHGLQPVVPAPAFRCLVLLEQRRVVDTAVFEELLPDILQLNDKLLPPPVFAEQVKDRLPVDQAPALHLRIQIRQLMDLLTLAQHLVQEVDQQLLVKLRSEKLLEAEVGEGVDVFFFGKHISSSIRYCRLLPPEALILSTIS